MAEVKGETDLCRHRLLKYCLGQGVDLGCGNVKIKPEAIGIDLYHPNADMHADVRDLSCYPDNQFDYVYSSHMLEELQNTEATIKEWLRILKPGGYLVLYQADRDLYFPLGHPQCNVAHKHHFKWDDLWAIIEKTGNVKLIQHGCYPECKEWSFELVIQKISNLPELKFKIMIPGGPAEKYIDKCISSLLNQSYQNWTAAVVLDLREDNTYEKALKYQNDKIQVKLNETVKGAVENALEAVRLQKPDDENVLVTLDADDWFFTPDTLWIIKSYYDRYPKILMTHGSWIAYPTVNVPTNNVPYDPVEFKLKLREFPWHASHVRTCKYKLWKHLKDEDLRDKTGQYYKIGGDVACTLPLMEMAGFDRIKFIPEVLYVYNQETPFNDDKVFINIQKTHELEIRSKTPYSYLDLRKNDL